MSYHADNMQIPKGKKQNYKSELLFEEQFLVFNVTPAYICTRYSKANMANTKCSY